MTIVHRRDAFRAHEHSVEVLKQSNVKIMTPYVPVALDGDGQFANSLTIQKVKSDETVELPLDALIVSFGFQHQIKTLKIGTLIINVQALRFRHCLRQVKKVFMRLVMPLTMKVKLL